ncbi:MAG: hypothetical protein Q8P89_02960 [bacterium]|nr:hypothetical protein [bacterium]
MKSIPREQKRKIKSGKKRIKTAFIFILFLLFLSAGGFLVRIYRQGDLFFFREEKILSPVVGKTPERELAEELRKTDIRVIYLSINSTSSLEASLSGGIKVIFKTGDFAQQVSSLQAMLARFKIEGRIPQKIDLRFEKPIVVF